MCLSRIAVNRKLSFTFVEIGCADGLENNSHLLLLNGFRGVWVDGAKGKIENIARTFVGSAFSRLWIVEAICQVGGFFFKTTNFYEFILVPKAEMKIEIT